MSMAARPTNRILATSLTFCGRMPMVNKRCSDIGVDINDTICRQGNLSELIC